MLLALSPLALASATFKIAEPKNDNIPKCFLSGKGDLCGCSFNHHKDMAFEDGQPAGTNCKGIAMSKALPGTYRIDQVVSFTSI